MSHPQHFSRRDLFQRTGWGIGGAALSSLLHTDTVAIGADRAETLPRPHFAPRAKRVIYIHLVGAPSHLDFFEPKPELQKRSGELCPESFFEGKQFAFIRERPSLMGSPEKPNWNFTRCGESGHPISNLLPELQGVADELCFIRSMHTEEFNHGPAQLFALTGFGRFGRPSIGAWTSYGLGSENSNLPAFVVLITGNTLGAGNSAWGSGFLPTVHQGVEFRGQGDPVLYLSNPKGIDATTRRRTVDAVSELNRGTLADIGDPEIATRIEQYELAYRMQTSVPELMDIGDEPKAIHELYGTRPGKPSFANNCLLARRMVERGVRFVQLFDQGWDHHGNIAKSLPNKARQIDRPIAALIRDLKHRGLLEDTLVVWSSEFGRTPMGQATGGKKAPPGRDHHKDCYTVWLAGGGVKGGVSLGASDEFGYSPIENPVHVHDFNATLLHLLGLDHERLTFRFQGRQYRLTDVDGVVQRSILA